MSLKQMQILDSTEAVKQERPAPCARHCEANAFQIVIKNLKAQLAQPEQCNYPDCKCPTENPCLKGLAQPEQEPVISKWVLREVYFDEDGEPVMHRSPPQPEQIPPSADSNTHQPERHELQAKGEHPAPCARHCEANAFQIVIKNLKAQLAQRKPLTDEELEAMAENHVTNCYFDTLKFARAIEAAHGIKENT